MLWRKLLGGAKSNGLVFVGSYTQAIAGITTDVTITLTSLAGGIESAPAAGDLVLVYFATGSVSATRSIAVDGYQQIAKITGDDSFKTHLVAAYKFMGSTPDTTFTLTGGTFSTSDGGAVAVQVWRGVNADTPLDVTQTTAIGANSVLCNPPAITPITPGAIIVAGGAGAHNAGAQTFSSSNLTAFRSVGENDTNDVTIGLGYHRWTSGPFDPAAFTFSASNSGAFSWAAITLALRPA